MIDRPSIEKRAYESFRAEFRRGAYGTQRLGQAFCNRFRLDKLSGDQARRHIDNLWNSDGVVAHVLIERLFDFH